MMHGYIAIFSIMDELMDTMQCSVIYIVSSQLYIGLHNDQHFIAFMAFETTPAQKQKLFLLLYYHRGIVIIFGGDRARGGYRIKKMNVILEAREIRLLFPVFAIW